MILSDHGGEFQNKEFERFSNENGIQHTFSTPWTPLQNRVVERKKLSLKELVRIMLNETNLPKYFWKNVVRIICHVMNHVLMKLILKMTPYELYK